MNEPGPSGQGPSGALKQRCERGQALLQANKVGSATDVFNEALRMDSGCAEAHFGLGECMERQGRVDEAMGEYRAVLHVDPKSVEARYRLGHLFLTKGKINEAIRQFMMVQMVEPHHVQARLSVGRCLEKKNLPGDALQDYRSIEADYPDCIDACLAAARCLIALDRVPEAVDEHRKAIALAPGRTDVRKALIRLLEGQGAVGEAIKEYQAILAMKPDAIDVRLDMASVMDTGGLIKAAIGEYARVMEMDPKNAFAFKKHQSLVREREKIDQLTDRYLGYVINRMENMGGHFREGMKLYLDGCYDDALGEFAAGTVEAPTAEAYFGHGACTVRTGSLLAAIPLFRETIRIEPEFREAHTMLGILYERHGLLYESAEEYEKGLKEVADRIKSGDGPRRNVDGRMSEPSFHFYRLA